MRWEGRQRQKHRSPLHTPGKKGHSKSERNVMINNFHFCMINSRVEDFYVEKKIVPACRNLLPVMREKINDPWGEQSLRRLVHKIRFRWQKCQK